MKTLDAFSRNEWTDWPEYAICFGLLSLNSLVLVMMPGSKALSGSPVP